MSKQFYVYLHLDPRVKSSFIYGKLKFNYEPFYVGKGCGKRAYSLKRNIFYNNILSKLTVLKLQPIVKIFLCSSEQNAFEIEKILVELIGRRELKLGPLTNLTDGGEGVSGTTLISERKRLKSFRKTMTNKTEYELKQISYKRMLTAANRSPEKQNKISHKCSVSAKKRWKTIPLLERKRIARKQQNTINKKPLNEIKKSNLRKARAKRNYWLSLTPEKRKNICKKCSKAHSNRSRIDKLNSISKFRKTLYAEKGIKIWAIIIENKCLFVNSFSKENFCEEKKLSVNVFDKLIKTGVKHYFRGSAKGLTAAYLGKCFYKQAYNHLYTQINNFNF